MAGITKLLSAYCGKIQPDSVEEYLELCKKVLEHYGYTVNKI